MKRTFVIAVLTGSLAFPAAAVFAANPTGPVGGPANAAPQQTLGGTNNQPGNPGQNPNQPGTGAPAANVVQNGDQRGALGNLASGGPSFSTNLKEMHGRLDGQALGGAVAAPAPGPDAKGVVAEGAPAAGPAAGGAAVAGGVVTEVKHEVKSPEHAAEAANYVFNFCRFRAMRRAFGPAMPPMMLQNGWIPGPAAPFGDLVLVNVGMIEDATPVHGPIYRITMLNDSPTPSIHFHVSLIAVLGEMNDSSIVVSVPVRFIAPKATASVDITLPVNVMAMGTPAVPFDTLVAAVDSFDELAETTKLNNVATLPRAEVVIVTVKTEVAPAAAVTTGTAQTQVSTTVQSGGVAAPAVTGQTVAAPAVAGQAVAGPANGAPAPAVAPTPAEGAAPAGPPAPANGGAAPEQGAQPAPATGAPAAPAQHGEAALPDLDKVDGASQILGG